MLSLDSMGENSGCRETGFDENDDMDHEDSGSGSEDDSIEERWVPQDEDFEAKVLRATENNFELAAQLIPRLVWRSQRKGRGIQSLRGTI